MNTDTKAYILILLLNIISIYSTTIPHIWKRLIHFLSVTFISTFILLDKTKNLFYFLISISITSLISCLYFITQFNIKGGIISFEINFLILLSIITYSGLLLSLFHLTHNNENEPLQGTSGIQGTPGKKGNQAPLLNTEDLCYQQLIQEASTSLENTTLNNLFMKQRLRHICNSDSFKNSVIENGSYEAISSLKNKVKEWITIILNYEQGSYFLNDYFEIPQNWNKLLSLNNERHEKTSPITLLERDPVWNW